MPARGQRLAASARRTLKIGDHLVGCAAARASGAAAAFALMAVAQPVAAHSPHGKRRKRRDDQGDDDGCEIPFQAQHDSPFRFRRSEAAACILRAPLFKAGSPRFERLGGRRALSSARPPEGRCPQRPRTADGSGGGGREARRPPTRPTRWPARSCRERARRRPSSCRRRAWGGRSGTACRPAPRLPPRSTG